MESSHVLAHSIQSLMQFAQQLFVFLMPWYYRAARLGNGRLMSRKEPPDPVQKSKAPFHSRFTPIQVFFGRRGKQDEQPHGISAADGHELDGANYIALV